MLAVAVPVSALYVPYTDTPVTRILVQDDYTGDYHIYKHEEGNVDCYVVVSTKYTTQAGISCLEIKEQ